MTTNLVPTDLTGLRKATTRWVIDLIDGPNMPHLGKRDPRLFGAVASLAEVQRMVVELGTALGVEVRTFASDYEGEVLEHIHAVAGETDGFLVDPGGLATVSEGLRHALQETGKPVVEVSFYNLVANGETSVITPTVIGRAMGLRQYSYLAGLLALVLSLDDVTFLNPEGPDSVTVRRGGMPYAFKNG